MYKRKGKSDIPDCQVCKCQFKRKKKYYKQQHIHARIVYNQAFLSTKYPYFRIKLLTLSFTFTDYSAFGYKPYIMVEGHYERASSIIKVVENDYHNQFLVYAQIKP